MVLIRKKKFSEKKNGKRTEKCGKKFSINTFLNTLSMCYEKNEHYLLNSNSQFVDLFF